MRASAPTDLGVGSGSGDCSQAPAFGQGSGVAEGDGAATEAGGGEAGAVQARGRARAGHQRVGGRGGHLEGGLARDVALVDWKTTRLKSSLQYATPMQSTPVKNK